MAKLPANPADLVDHLLELDPRLQRLMAEIHRGQRRLRRVVGRDEYRVYLRIDDSVHEWCRALVERVWAIARERRRRGGGPCGEG